MVVTHPLFPNGTGSPSFVLHASIVLGWIVPRLANVYADGVLRGMPGKKPVVPVCWILHIAEGLLLAQQQGLFTPVQTGSKLATLRNYPILFDDESDARAWSDALDLARAHSITVVDATYLELALRLNLPLATTDAALTRAAAAGASTFTP